MAFKRLLATVSIVILAGCTTAQRKEDADPAGAQMSELRSMLVAMSTRLESLENKVSSVNDKVDATRAGLEGLAKNGTPTTATVAEHPAETRGTPVNTAQAKSDPESGLTQDAAVKVFREAMILFKAARYPDAALAFSSFLERFADHPLAGSAQFHIGESYFRQKEYKLAIQEYQRVLTSYDRSSRVSDALRQMALAEEAVRLSQDSAKHQQLLTSLFPNSPAASLSRAKPANDHATSQTTPETTPHDTSSEGTSPPRNEAALDEPPMTAPAPEQHTAEEHSR